MLYQTVDVNVSVLYQLAKEYVPAILVFTVCLQLILTQSRPITVESIKPTPWVDNINTF